MSGLIAAQLLHGYKFRTGSAAPQMIRRDVQVMPLKPLGMTHTVTIFTRPSDFGVSGRSKAAVRPSDPATPTNDEIRTLAVKVLGTAALASEWMSSPAIGLEQRRPKDLLATREGARRVLLYLHQIEHGVYV